MMSVLINYAASPRIRSVKKISDPLPVAHAGAFDQPWRAVREWADLPGGRRIRLPQCDLTWLTREGVSPHGRAVAG
ncbi:hypothetical protein KRMM14A1259_48550 [Krasilnikovia sp. MM14-A1259]